MNSTIGLKIANGKFYPLIKENSNAEKRIILTNVFDNQQTLKVQLYKSKSSQMVDAIFIGSFIIDNIDPLPKGEAHIELTVSSYGNGDINAYAVQWNSGEKGEQHCLDLSRKLIKVIDTATEIEYYQPQFFRKPPPGLLPALKYKKRRPWLAAIFVILVFVISVLVVLNR